MVKEQAELAVYWKKMSSFSCVGDLHSHSCGDLCERLCGLQQHRSWDTNRLADLMRKALRLEVTVLHPGSSRPPSTPPAEQTAYRVTPPDWIWCQWQGKRGIHEAFLSGNWRLLAVTKRKRRGCTEKDPVIALLGCCRRLSFALQTPTSPQVVRSCKRVESVKMKSIKNVFFLVSYLFKELLLSVALLWSRCISAETSRGWFPVRWTLCADGAPQHQCKQFPAHTQLASCWYLILCVVFTAWRASAVKWLVPFSASFGSELSFTLPEPLSLLTT